MVVAIITLLAGCATTYDLPEKYAGVIGRQYRTPTDAYIWRSSVHQYEFTPYHLSDSDEYKAARLEFIPAGTVITVKAAKRSYKGGDWDYLIAEVRAPKSGTLYEFEVLLGFSSYFPGDVEKLWEPVGHPAFANISSSTEPLIHAPNARFSIRKRFFITPWESETVTESQNPGSLVFNFPNKGIVRIDYCTAPQQLLPDAARKSKSSNVLDQTLDAVIEFTRSKTRRLKELNLLAKHSAEESGKDQSSAVFRIQFDGGAFDGTFYRGIMVFSRRQDSFVLHYQTGEVFANDQAAEAAVLAKLTALRAAMVFHTE